MNIPTLPIKKISELDSKVKAIIKAIRIKNKEFTNIVIISKFDVLIDLETVKNPMITNKN